MKNIKELKENLKFAKIALRQYERPNEWHLYYISQVKELLAMIKKISDMPNIHFDATKPMDEYFTGMFNGLECMRATLNGDEPEYKECKIKKKKDVSR